MPFGFFRHDPALLAQVVNIQSLRKTVGLVRDSSSTVYGQSLKSLWAGMGKALTAVAHVRYAFTSPIRAHDWIMAFDGKRGRPVPEEAPYTYLTRVCQTNRPTSLPHLIGMEENDRIILIDMANLFSKNAESYGSLAFLCRLAGPWGLWRLAHKILVGLIATRRPSSAIIYATLDMVRHRAHLTRRGLLMTTSSTWLIEALRAGLLAARSDVKVIEVLHGASTTTVSDYFRWVHDQAAGTPVYVNLIADLPRFAPQNTHLLTDEEGEIACNIRLWQDRTDKLVTIPRDQFTTPAVLMIGGGSMDVNYESSSYFAKEIALIQALRDRVSCPIRYCVHPMHTAALQARLITRMEVLGCVTAQLSAPDEILAARVVVGGFSTALVEAALLGRKTFAYEDLGALFIPEIAQMITYNSDFNALAAKIAQVAEKMPLHSYESDFQTVSDLARKRYGLELKLV